jgi:hypothetical protein
MESSTAFTTETLKASLQKSTESKSRYEEKLETATGIDIYKYVLLINVAALEGYVAQARTQAQDSFKLSKNIAITGFIILTVAILLSIGLTVFGNANLNASYLAAISGIITEFIAGVFFLLYTKTLSQINVFHDKLVDMQKTALTHIGEYKTVIEPSYVPKNKSEPLSDVSSVNGEKES